MTWIFTEEKIMLRLLDLPQRLLYRWKRRSLRRSSNPSPVVGFGGVLENKSIIHGGAVKLLSLRKNLSPQSTEAAKSFVAPVLKSSGMPYTFRALRSEAPCSSSASATLKTCSKAMENNEKNFNILYLVSSAQPKFAEDLVKTCRKRGIPFFWNQNGVGYPAWAGKASERHNAPMRRLRAQADYVIYQSIFCRDSAEGFLGPSLVPSEVLLNPVNLQKFFPLSERPPISPLRLLALGTHGYAERVLSTLHCLKAVRDAGQEAVLTIAGKFQWGGGEASICREIERLGLTAVVTLLPAFTQDQAVKLYQAHHIVLHPKYLDPCPTVVVEALASGCPVVGSASGGVPELVGNDCGFLVPAPLSWDQMITPTGAELAAGVMEILPHFDSYATAARIRGEELFDEERWVERHRKIFLRVLSKLTRSLPLGSPFGLL